MFRKILLQFSVFVLFPVFFGFSQTDWEWKQHLSITPIFIPNIPVNVAAKKFSVDGQGNLIIAGIFNGKLAFGNDTISSDSGQLFVVKLNQQRKLLWAKTFRNFNQDTFKSSTVDKNGNIFLFGILQGVIRLDTTVLTSIGYAQNFIAKINSEGKVMWAKQSGDTAQIAESDLSPGTNPGEVLIGGTLRRTNHFFGKPVSIQGFSDAVIARVNTDGNIEWVKTYGGPDWDIVKRIATDPSGHILLSGVITGSASFGSFQIINPVPYNQTGYVAKLNSDGEPVWAKPIGDVSDNYNKLWDMICDHSGNQIVLGTFQGTVVLGNQVFNSSNGETGYLAKVNPNGEVVWAIQYPKAESEISAISVGPFNEIFLMHRLKIYKIDPSGNQTLLNSIRLAVPNTGYATLNAIPVDGLGNPYVLGEYSTEIIVDSDTLPRGFGGGGMCFIGKLGNKSGSGFHVTGKVYAETDTICTPSSGEAGMAGMLVTAVDSSGDKWFGYSDSTGHYDIQPKSGSYTISATVAEPRNLVLENVCPRPSGIHTANLSTAQPLDSGNHFGLRPKPCPFLRVEVASARRRRCFRGNTYIRYWNEGFASQQNVKVHVKWPEFVSPISANIPYSWNISDSTIVFELGVLEAGATGLIRIIDSVSCGDVSILGITQCTKAWISPSNSCITPPPGWDGTDLVIKAKCVGFYPRFTIVNKGQAMAGPRNYRVFRDSLFVLQQTFQLGSGDSLVFSIPGSGNFTYRVEADQSPFHPFSTVASAQTSCQFFPIAPAYFPPDDEDPVISYDCQVIRGAYDPNDKEVWPKGSTAAGLVQPKSLLKYRIRFQNTGNDTAINVIIEDSLAEGFDIRTLQNGVSSHSARLQISGGKRPVLKWHFKNILLPDSNTNEEASHGFVEFRIEPFDTLALGSRLSNHANIYFDYNDPIRTNSTLNTLYVPEITSGILDSVTVITHSAKFIQGNHFKIVPNPAKESFRIPGNERCSVRILDVFGREILRRSPSENQPILVTGFQKGIYFVEMQSESGLSVQKLLIE